MASFPLADVEASRLGLSLELQLCENIDERAMQRPVHGDPARVTGAPARGLSARSGHPLKRQQRPVVSPANTPRRKKDSPARRETRVVRLLAAQLRARGAQLRARRRAGADRRGGATRDRQPRRDRGFRRRHRAAGAQPPGCNDAAHGSGAERHRGSAQAARQSTRRPRFQFQRLRSSGRYHGRRQSAVHPSHAGDLARS